MINPFKQDTTDSVVATLSNMVMRLQVIGNGHSADAAYHGDLAKEYATKSAASLQEAVRAKKIADKIGALLEP